MAVLDVYGFQCRGRKSGINQGNTTPAETRSTKSRPINTFGFDEGVIQVNQRGTAAFIVVDGTVARLGDEPAKCVEIAFPPGIYPLCHPAGFTKEMSGSFFGITSEFAFVFIVFFGRDVPEQRFFGGCVLLPLEGWRQLVHIHRRACYSRCRPVHL